jgi:phenylacetate-CoA ligase
MRLSILRRLGGSAVIASHLHGQTGVPFWPREKLERVRDARIRMIVQHAARTVPYYRQLFAREGIDPREIRTAADLDRLPALDREVVRENPKLFVSESSKARNALSFLTSGSTGIPAEIFHDRHSLLANIPYGERERDPIVRKCGSLRPKELYVGYETSTFKKVLQFYDENAMIPRPQRRFVRLREPVERIAAILNEERPDVLVGYGGWIDLFFKTILARRIDIHPPKMVIYMGEALPHGAREFIEQRFGLPVLSRYNAVESFKIGYFCECRSGFHIHEDLCHLRVVDRNGRNAGPGVQGEILISNLVNMATVLLNYSIGDLGTPVGESCRCGRTFRLISELEGRVEDILPLPDGSFVHPRSVWQALKGDPDILQYQLIQKDWTRFEVALATLDEQAFHRALARRLPGLKDLLGPEAVIDATHRTYGTSRPGLKFRAVVSKVRQEAGIKARRAL